MKKQRKFLLTVISILVVTIALLAFTSSQVKNDDKAENAELVIEKGSKTEFSSTASYNECGDGKCGDDKKDKKKKKDKKAHDKKKKGDKCGEGKCGEGKCGEGKEKSKEKKSEKAKEKTSGEE